MPCCRKSGHGVKMQIPQRSTSPQKMACPLVPKACSLLTLELGAVRGALSLVHDAVEIGVEEAVVLEDGVDVDAVVLGRVQLVRRHDAHKHHKNHCELHGGETEALEHWRYFVESLLYRRRWRNPTLTMQFTRCILGTGDR